VCPPHITRRSEIDGFDNESSEPKGSAGRATGAVARTGGSRVRFSYRRLTVMLSNGRNTGDTQLSLLSAKSASQTGLSRTTQPLFSTLSCYVFAGHVASGLIQTQSRRFSRARLSQIICENLRYGTDTVLKMKRGPGKCPGCGRRRVLEREAYLRLCDSCRRDSKVLRKLCIFRRSDLCRYGHSVDEHGRGEESSRLYGARPTIVNVKPLSIQDRTKEATRSF
jgi:hypothetical protein